MPQISKIKITNLEALRGFAALIVALFHFQIGSHITDNSFVKHGSHFVEFFFILSGFVIAHNYSEKIINFKDLLKFQIKRFWRLYPVHIIVLLLYLFLEIAKLIFVEYTSIKPTEKPFSENHSLANFLESIFLIQGVFEDKYVWNNSAWSISTEFYTYLFYGIIIFIFRKQSILIFSFIVLLNIWPTQPEILNKLNFLSNYFNFFSNQFRQCIYLFSFGVVINFIFKKINNLKIPEFFCWLSLIISIFIMANLHSLQINHKYLYISFAILVFFSALVSEKALYSKMLNLTFIQFLGKISYSVYMIHFFIAYILSQIMRFIFKVNMIYSDGAAAQIKIDKFSADIFTISYLIIVIFTSYTMYRLIEDKFRIK